MLFTIHRYIFRELMRVFILATVALTLILSLGSILQPVQEYGAGPRQVVLFSADNPDVRAAHGGSVRRGTGIWKIHKRQRA